MKSCILVLAVLFVFCLCVAPAAKAGPFSLDNLVVSNAGAFDVADDAVLEEPPPPAIAAPAVKAAPAAQKPSPAATNAARRALQRRNAPVSPTSTDAALGVTKGACANGQCGR